MSLNFQELLKVKIELAKATEKQILALSLFHITKDNLIENKVVRFRLSLNDDFKTNPPIDKADISITSSVTCIKSFMLANEHITIDFEGFVSAIYEKHKTTGLFTTGLNPGNPFTIGLLLPVLNQITFAETHPKYQEYKEVLLFCIEQAKLHLNEGGISFEHFPKNGYLTYYNLIGLSESEPDIKKICNTSLQWSRDELFKQISYFEANDEEEADVFQLGYNLLIQYRFCRNTLRESIIDLCLKIIFSSQLKRGVWEKKTPLFNYANRGDAFPFSFELLNAIFNEFSGVEEKLMPYEAQLYNAYEWTKKNAKKEVINEIEIQLWKSVTREEKVLAESWATSEVYLFLYHFKKYISRRTQKIVLTEFDGKIYSKSDVLAFENLSLPEIHFTKTKENIQLDALFIERLFNPLKILYKPSYSLTQNMNKDLATRSGILFGPPGTGKTTYAKCIAKYLGWPLVIINPSDFAKEGLTLMPRVASEIFSKLMELEDTVIFFDEMESLISSRDNPLTVYEQKFLTTTLLPKLQTLHDKASSIFLVATNYLGDIDPAAQREGRFDFKIQILPPSINSKYKTLESKLKESNLSSYLAPIKEALEYNEDIKDAIRLSTRKEFNTLIKEFISKKCNSKEVKDLVEFFKNNYSLKKELKKIKLADEENIFVN